MRLYYIATTAKCREIKGDWHALDLGEDKHLVCVGWQSEGTEAEWANHPDVTRLPHPILEPQNAIESGQQAHLARRFDMKNVDNVHHLIQQAAEHDPWMRLYVL
ncbi:MAG TPA: hypothetical protein VNI35_00415 [Nitrospira sp.]|nr:hypothetical protein [Nitrospira sp.]